ncbi:MAG TPA: hypothetical protein VGI10_06280 [Polyangiaceae bacterium]|jgi:hypothetical protein
MLLRQPPSGPIVRLPSFAEEVANLNVLGVASIDWSLSPAQVLGITANCNVSSLNLPPGPTWLQLRVVQGPGGGFTPTFVGAKTPGGTPLALSAAPGSIDILSLFSNGTDLFVSVAGLAYS